MPYGAKKTTFGNRRSAVKARQSAARAKTVAAARGRLANAPVKRAYYRRRVTKRSNYTAISTLARQVKQLQYDRNGFKQWHHTYLQPAPSYPPGTPADVMVQAMRPLRDQPYAFMVNDFTTNSEVFYGYIPTGTTVPSFGIAQQFEVVTQHPSLDDNYAWNIKQGQDTCLTTHYLPIKSTMRFELQCLSMAPTEDPITVRISMIKLLGFHFTLK